MAAYFFTSTSSIFLEIRLPCRLVKIGPGSVPLSTSQARSAAVSSRFR